MYDREADVRQGSRPDLLPTTTTLSRANAPDEGDNAAGVDPSDGGPTTGTKGTVSMGRLFHVWGGRAPRLGYLVAFSP